MDEINPDQLSCFFLIAIQNHLCRYPSTKETVILLAETFAQLHQEQSCQEDQDSVPNPSYIAALGTLVYYKKH